MAVVMLLKKDQKKALATRLMALGKERGFQHWLKNREKFFYALVALIIKVLFD